MFSLFSGMFSSSNSNSHFEQMSSDDRKEVIDILQKDSEDATSTREKIQELANNAQIKRNEMIEKFERNKKK